jgi:hypothetical protein
MNTHTDLVVLVPMLGRAQTMAPLRDSLHDTAPGADLLWIVTDGDTEVLAGVGSDDLVLVVPQRKRGDYAHKINRASSATDHRLLFLGGCDIRFHPGWIDACRARLADGALVVGTNDLGNPATATGQLSTHTLVDRRYLDLGTADEPGVLLHEGYWHEYVDTEFVATAKARGVYAHAPDAVVEHLHPRWGKAPTDPLYAQARKRMTLGRAIYRRRRRLWTT